MVIYFVHHHAQGLVKSVYQPLRVTLQMQDIFEAKLQRFGSDRQALRLSASAPCDKLHGDLQHIHTDIHQKTHRTPSVFVQVLL